jgi:NitT/TauT family transport system substrate-binding protein
MRRMKMNKKIIAVVISAVIAIGSLSGCSSNTAKKLDRPIQLGYYGSACESYFYAAELKGLYEKAGLKVNFIRVDEATAKEGLASGKLDVSDGILQSWLKPIEQGLDIKFTLGMHNGCMSTAVKADSPYKSLADLKGKTIGVLAPIGGGPMNYLYRELLHEGFNPKNEFNWLAFDRPSIVNALDTNKADAIVTSDSQTFKGVQNGKYRYLTYMATDDYIKDELCCLLAFSPKFLKDYPDAAKGFTKAIYDASEYVQNNKEVVVRYADSKKYLNGNVEDNLAVVKTYTFKPSVANGIKSFENSFRDYQATGIIDKDVDMQKVVDRAFVKFDGIDKN